MERYRSKLGKIKGERCSESDDIPINILTESIWFNKKLKIDNTIFLCFFFYYKWCDAGIFFINDLHDENNEFLSFNRFQEIYGIEPTFFTVYGNFTYDTTNLEG